MESKVEKAEAKQEKIENPHKFRIFHTTSGNLVFAGRSAENNEALVFQAKPSEILIHTAQPGSPFANIKTLKPTKKDIAESAVFCARYSQDWRDRKADVIVHVFYKKDTYKDKKMKLGTFGVKKNTKLKIKKVEIQEFIKQQDKKQKK